MKRTALAIAGSIVIASAALAGMGPGPAAADDAPECPTSSELQGGLTVSEVSTGTDVVDCDLIGEVVSIKVGAGGIEIPSPGETVARFAFAADDSGEENLTVVVAENGALNYDPTPVVEDPTAGSACDDSFFTVWHGSLDQQTEQFWIKSSTFPSNLNTIDTRQSIVEGVGAWPSQYNDCGMSDEVNVSSSYQGDTSADSSVGTDGTCRALGRDSASIVTFGAMTTSAPGITCLYTSTLGSQAADIKFDSDYPWTNTGGASGCTNGIDVKSLATHEAGHLWGLDDISATVHPNLTMRGGGLSSVQCNTKLRTLGRGDVLGMRHIY